MSSKDIVNTILSLIYALPLITVLPIISVELAKKSEFLSFLKGLKIFSFDFVR